MNRESVLCLLETRVLGRELMLLDEVDSTNRLAGRMFAEKNLRDGMVIIACRQTAGMGRFHRPWHSEGGLCMTVAVELSAPASSIGPITLAAGVGVAVGLSVAAGRGFFLKYPNDILSEKENGRKVGGILSEVKSDGGRPMVILGIGINLHQEIFPPELVETATSIRLLGGSCRTESAAASILNSLETWLDILKAGDFSRILAKWLELDCTLGKSVVIRNVLPAIEGRAEGLDRDGALLVKTNTGIRRVTAGEVVFGKG